MRSVVIVGQSEVSVETVPDPVLTGPDGAIVQVERTAICGSDLHFYDGDLPFYPVAPGHEAIGTVVEVGPDVTRFRVGDRVLVSCITGCGTCRGCAAGDPATCVDGPRIFGAGDLGGAQSELLAVPGADHQLLLVPDGIDDEAALLLTDNLGTGWSGAVRAEVGPGSTVAVLGLGAVGLCAVRSALALGADRVFALDPVAGRRERAVASGAEAVGSAEELLSMGPVDAVIDAVALNASLDTAFAAVRAGGTVSVIGVHDLSPYPLNLTMGVLRSVTLRMTTAILQRSWGELVPLVQKGELDTTGIFTHRFDLAEADKAYAAVAARTADCVKVVLTP
jgi:2-desacetyl-2-hydroxyethyl bacteriochlorophyllide A dehydrogenase